MMSLDFKGNGDGFKITDKMKEQFDKYGCLMIRNLLSKPEVTHIVESLSSREFKRHMYGVDDGEGRLAHMAIWNQPGDDVTGMVARSEKIACSCETLLGGEVYHYHSKLMGKPPREGGRHVWHQDYGYWYHNGCLVPDMMTVFIAIDKCEKTNGCLQFLPGSSRCGRIDHHKIGGQYEADEGRVKDIIDKCPLQYAEMEPGDVLFMHCNVLHCSSANHSDFRRWALLCCFNSALNDPVKVHHHSSYIPLKKVKDEEILKCTKLVDEDGKLFMPSKTDTTSFLKTVGKRIYED